MSTTLGIIASSRSQAAPLLLDAYPGAFAAYSLRKLRTAYTGPAIRVRRSSDNTETDIGFNGGGTLDTTALTTFVGAGNGFVRTWYDQSGNGRNQIQTVNANQPSIVTSGAIILVNGKPCISQDGVSGRMLSLNASINVANLSIFQVFKINDTTFQTNFGGGSNYVLFGFTSSFPSDSITVSSRFKNGVSLVTNDAPQVTTNYGNDTQILSSAFYTGAVTWSSFGWGNSTSWPTVGQIQEHIWYTSSQAANRTGFETNINSFYSVYPIPPVVSDPDAQAFVNRVYNAGGTLTSTEANAVNTLTIDLKANGIWSLMKAIYPMVGASAAACAQNLVSSSYTGTFTNGWTFSSTGATPNGTSAFMNTNFLPSSDSSLNNAHLSYYSRTQITGTNGVDIGSTGGTGLEYYMAYNAFGGTYIGMHSNFINVTALPTTTKMFISSRLSSSEVKVYYAGSLYQTITSNSVNLNTFNVYLGVLNAFALLYYSSRQCAFASIGDGLTDTQASNFYTAVQAMQTSLSRQI
ncbi:MAG: arabinofuranosidase catalytic domain-containing protein [Dolichospermum sp.]